MLKKSIKLLCITMMMLCMVGCSKESGKTTNEVGKDAKQSVFFQAKDLEWEFSTAILDGKRAAIANVKNNSDQSIVDLDLKFKFKEDVTEEQKEAYYKKIGEMLNVSDEYLKQIKQCSTMMRIDYDGLIKAKSETNNIPLYYCEGLFTVKDKKQSDLMEADFMILTFINDGKLYEMSYDFISDSSSIQDLETEANQWKKTKHTEMLPTPKAEYVIEMSDDEDGCSYDVYGVEKTDVKEYIKACKEKGFTKDVVDDDIRFHAINEQGYEVSIMYTREDHKMDIGLAKEK